MSVTCPEIYDLKPGDGRNVLLSLDEVLDQDNSINELVATIVEVTTAEADLTISDEAITTVARKCLNKNVRAGKAITFQVTAADDATPAEGLRVSAKFTTSGGQTLTRDCLINIVTS